MAAGKSAAAPAVENKAVGFVPAVSFLGFPDGVTGKWYHAGKHDSAPAEYVELLRAKGLVIEPATTPATGADNIESEEK